MNEDKINYIGEADYSYMNSIFKKENNSSYKGNLLWNDGVFNWLGFRLLMFEFWGYKSDECFSLEHYDKVKFFSELMEGEDGHDPYYDFYGKTLINTQGSIKKTLE